MKKYINILRKKFKKYKIDGYVVPKNDDYFTEYSRINRLKIISNFSGSAGLAIILKKKNYLFTDGRYSQLLIHLLLFTKIIFEASLYLSIVHNK